GPLSELPATVTSIDWNFEGAQGYTANYNQEFSFQSTINFVSWDFSTIALLLPGVLDRDLGIFPQDKTNIDLNNPPYLDLPEGRFFQGQSIAIEDGIGAVVTATNKRPSDNSYYETTDGILLRQPDTLVITLSEKIRAEQNTGTPWDSLFLFGPPFLDKSEAYPLIALPGVRPIVQGPDSLVWLFIVDNSMDTYKPSVDDVLFLNPEAPYTDVSIFVNKPEDAEIIIKGSENAFLITQSAIFVPVIGTDVNGPHSIVANLHIDEKGTVSPGRDAILVEKTDGSYEYMRNWIKPAGLRDNGTIAAPGTECLLIAAEDTRQTEYPENCLSAVQVYSKDSYTAEVIIFDHMGKFVHQSKQYFGQCGELENRYRRTTRGLLSWLVWNQKNEDGDYVGTGVYIWRVTFTTSAGRQTEFYRQGIIRTDKDPDENCAGE
ncbi:MAG: hypothetical protein HQK83_15015, partial [Fibrobacteria bacterium]|nr:hypothetical protein [Fibrobacteria bacterium]